MYTLILYVFTDSEANARVPVILRDRPGQEVVVSLEPELAGVQPLLRGLHDDRLGHGGGAHLSLVMLLLLCDIL